MKRAVHHIIIAIAALGVLGFGLLSPRSGSAGLASLSLIAEVQSEAIAATLLDNLGNEFMVLDSEGRLVWRASEADVTVSVDPKSEDLTYTVALPDGYSLDQGHEFVWRCDARRVTSTTYMRSLTWVDKADVSHPGDTSARPVQGYVGEAEVR